LQNDVGPGACLQVYLVQHKSLYCILYNVFNDNITKQFEILHIEGESEIIRNEGKRERERLLKTLNDDVV